MPSPSSYRQYIRERHGSLYKVSNKDKPMKSYRVNRDIIRDTIIKEYKNSGFEPAYMITRTYYYEVYNRAEVQKDNERLNNVLNDLFNTRGTSEYYVDVNHFIERHEDKLKKKSSKAVKNTITNEYELDWDKELVEGRFHVHSLVGRIDDDVIIQPSSKIRKAIEREYGLDEIPFYSRDDEGIEKLKLDIMERTIRERCRSIGNSLSSLDVRPTNECREYDGYRGWMGAVAYVTKQMYNADKIVEI